MALTRRRLLPRRLPGARGGAPQCDEAAKEAAAGYEPLPQEDLVSVDATHITATGAWPGGFFASYHAYPYYPDFMRLTPEYQSYKRPRDGVADAYSGYLHELAAYHGDQAVMITEFGIPSSLGVAHFGPNGRDQGNHSEQEALAMDAEMLRNIDEEGYAGGIVFQWVDEWFKLTWNTLDLELPPDRRQMWRNDLTNEEFFGVVAAEPGDEPVVVVDGDDDEWESNDSQVIAESTGPVREVRAVKDEQSLYLRLRLDADESWKEHPITVGLDVRPGGNQGLPATRACSRRPTPPWSSAPRTRSCSRRHGGSRRASATGSASATSTSTRPT
jgi:hypothetical protein